MCLAFHLNAQWVDNEKNVLISNQTNTCRMCTCKSKRESINCPRENDENVYYVKMNNGPLKGVQKSISDISIPGRVLKFNSQRENF